LVAHNARVGYAGSAERPGKAWRQVGDIPFTGDHIGSRNDESLRRTVGFDIDSRDTALTRKENSPDRRGRGYVVYVEGIVGRDAELEIAVPLDSMLAMPRLHFFMALTMAA
jgi:hypothetical protein